MIERGEETAITPKAESVEERAHLYAHQDDLSPDTLIDLAQEISLDLDRFIDDLREASTARPR